MGGGSRKHPIHFSRRLTLSVAFFLVLCWSSPLYYNLRLHFTITKLHSSCSVAVSSLSFTCLFIPVSSRSVPQALLSFYCHPFIVLKPSFCLLLSTDVSTAPALISSSHKNSIFHIQPGLFVTTPRACAMKSRGGTTGAVQLKQLATDYSQQKHTTWADDYCSIKS